MPTTAWNALCIVRVVTMQRVDSAVSSETQSSTGALGIGVSSWNVAVSPSKRPSFLFPADPQLGVACAGGLPAL